MLYFNIHKSYIVFYANMVPCVAPHVVQRFYKLWCKLATDFIGGEASKAKASQREGMNPYAPIVP